MRYFHAKSIFSFFSYLCGALLLSFTAHSATTTRTLTDNNIKAFIKEMTDTATSAKAGIEADKATRYFQTHLHPRAFFKSTVNYNMPGFPPQKNELSFNKEDYIESIINSDSVGNYEADVKVTSIRISKDKRKATITTTSAEHASITIPQAGRNETVPMAGNSSCNQIIMLSDQHVMQLYSANCKTDMEFGLE